MKKRKQTQAFGFSSSTNAAPIKGSRSIFDKFKQQIHS